MPHPAGSGLWCRGAVGEGNSQKKGRTEIKKKDEEKGRKGRSRKKKEKRGQVSGALNEYCRAVLVLVTLEREALWC